MLNINSIHILTKMSKKMKWITIYLIIYVKIHSHYKKIKQINNNFRIMKIYKLKYRSIIFLQDLFQNIQKKMNNYLFKSIKDLFINKYIMIITSEVMLIKINLLNKMDYNNFKKNNMNYR